ncbi:isorenieratene synthase [Micromonospora phaseoli]|uniref:Isorenieratene synthase n=1 Tax=Micromonospora phaseoli TaxID=1144548 RepID=A0A1H7DQJ9_9ACTN|nr:FAD-dependent oxidoreductase [Micromonospora phaseoli]PZW02366.1 isorenieratene synthase [Micromonospora phaseoli]GIJ75632.1 isorenieratene synthase [Micromonospora phaseoli]SEK01560.1 isorenieratene synthase [Micromonospora phaseoli]
MALSQLVGRLIGVRRHEVDPGGGGASRVPGPVTAVVVGGGIAGMSAAVVLAERGVEVTVLEAAPTLGGRLGAWPETLADGTGQVNEHGFHAFFRQYYNWRNILRRIDPALRFLRAVPGYPVLSAQWPTEEFGKLPPAPPANLLALLARSPSLRLRDLRGMDRDAALPLLTYDPVRTYAEFDHTTADELLTSLRLPDRARAMLFEVFSHSFFNHEAEMSAAEMIAQFHFYLLGNPQGLAFDCPDEDYATAIWAPLTRHVERHGGRVRTGVTATELHRDSAGWRVHTPEGTYQAGHVVLAVDPPALAALVKASPSLAEEAPALAAAMPGYGRPGPPYAVARYWCDGDVDPGRAVFNGVSRQATLDSVTLYHRLEHESRRWAQRTGGSVIELHAYACEADVPAGELAERMRAELTQLWPETDRLVVRELRARVEAKAPAFAPGSHAGRPGVRTGADRLYLAGDGIRTDFPSALMERAAATGIIAANHILRAEGGAAEPIHSVRPRGLLARP